MRSEGKLPSGSVMDCLSHYLGQLPWEGKGCVEARKPLADFLGINPATIRCWFVGSAKPLGLQLVKLRYFLEERGYDVQELHKLPGPVMALGKAIAYGKIGFDDAVEKIHMSQGSELLQVLHGNRGVSNERMATIVRICGDTPFQEGERPAPADPTGEPAQAAPSGKTEEEIINLLNSLDGLCALLEPRLGRMLSNAVTPEQRQAFREKAGRHRVFDMANRFFRLNKQLNALCSEKAREITAQNQNQR